MEQVHILIIFLMAFGSKYELEIFLGSFGCGTFARLVASMVKWTTPEPCIGLCESDPKSESDSKIYIDFEFCEEKIINNLKKNKLIYKAKQIMLTKIISRK